MSSMDAAKVAASSDKNVKDVFEQHKCWPVGRVPFMGRVFASATVRQATERPVSCVCYDVA
ncbi:hypothetical protein F6Q06_08810 [Pectobacterium parmentieri]|uniref:Uncharacterized protein n=1 Tax=Pectobacterium parmentieri TaxID=1905730 RepID=A0ABS0RYE8_PECPM|nr:hypothetical protein [Pectobacterium parmentieri]MBI0491990.1 hypothetical protein [Pectobacterium parmentieri]MBI0549385.1 hypothetical protein [Pectobacterium parmentieri]MBI0554586.1 hypothetical protein [Pectobacterium parmentieri]MBI0558533.1 hypothetical protein [Pectobacterium parmentieri]